MGINTGLRISDILKLKVSDLKGSHISMREKKTGKQKRIQLTPALKRELRWYIEEREDNDYLIKSREGKNKLIGRSMAYKILRATAAEFGLDEIGTHTLRKTLDIICTCKQRISHCLWRYSIIHLKELR